MYRVSAAGGERIAAESNHQHPSPAYPAPNLLLVSLQKMQCTYKTPWLNVITESQLSVHNAPSKVWFVNFKTFLPNISFLSSGDDTFNSTTSPARSFVFRLILFSPPSWNILQTNVLFCWRCRPSFFSGASGVVEWWWTFEHTTITLPFRVLCGMDQSEGDESL